MFNQGNQFLTLCHDNQCTISDVMIRQESHTFDISEEAILQRMQSQWEVMQQGIHKAMTEELISMGGLIGGEGRKLLSRCNEVTANAIISAEMALAGIKSVIPFDEVVVAMGKVGKSLPETLRETAKGGIAITPTGCRIKERILTTP